MARTNTARGTKARSEGHLTLADATHFRLESKVSLSGEKMPGGMTISRLAVADGEVLWTQGEMPRAGLQVQKVSFKDLEKKKGKFRMHREGPIVDYWNPDPFFQVKEISNLAHFMKVKEAGGKVTLQGKVNQKVLKSHPEMANLEISGVTLVLDETTAYPLKMEAAGKDGPVLILTFSNYLFPKEMDRSQFLFKVPGGVHVQDLGKPDSGSIGNPGPSKKGKPGTGIHREGGRS